MPDLSIRAMATALGITKSQAGRDKLDGMPMHDVDAARAWRAAHRDMSRTAEGRIDRPADTPAPEADDPPPSDTDTAAYRQARTEREQIRRDRERLELQRDLGEVVNVDDVARLRQTEYRYLRDSIANVPLRIKHKLATETDADQIEQILTTELDAVLTAFADQVLARGVTQEDDDDEPA